MKIRYLFILIAFLFCADTVAQTTSYYIRATGGTVRRKSEDSGKWTECSVTGMEQIELTDSVMVDDNSDVVIIRQNGSAKAIVATDARGKLVIEDMLREADNHSGTIVAENNNRVQEGDGSYRTARMSTRGTLGDVDQVDSLAKTVRYMIERMNEQGGENPSIYAEVVSDEKRGDYISVINLTDKTYYINVLVREDNDMMYSLYGDITEESTTIDNQTFPFIAVASNGVMHLNMYRFFELAKLNLFLVATEDVYNIVTFNSLLTDEGNGSYSEKMAQKSIIRSVKK